MTKVALIDMDGTVADYHGQLTKDLQGGTRTSAEMRSRPGWWENLPVIDLGMKTVELLHQMGYSLMVLSKGPYHDSQAWSEKVRWCRSHFPAEWGVKVTLTEDKSLVYGQILVDDWPPYGIAWLERRPRGLLMVPASEWNSIEAYPEHLRPQVFRFSEVPTEAEIQSRIDTIRNKAGEPLLPFKDLLTPEQFQLCSKYAKLLTELQTTLLKDRGQINEMYDDVSVRVWGPANRGSNVVSTWGSPDYASREPSQVEVGAYNLVDDLQRKTEDILEAIESLQSNVELA